MDALMILYFILGLSVLVLFHEFGHFIWAKIFHVYVYEFSLFMGPLLFQVKGKETKYSLRLLPIGGYCSLAGEEDSQAIRNEKEKLEEEIKKEVATKEDIEHAILNNVSVEDVVNTKKQNKIKEIEDNLIEVPNERSLLGLKWYKKIIIMAAGGLNNILLCFLMLLIYFGSINAPKATIDSNSIAYQSLQTSNITIIDMQYRFFETSEGRKESDEEKLNHLQGSVATTTYQFTTFDDVGYLYQYGHEYIGDRIKEEKIQERIGSLNTIQLTEEIILYTTNRDEPYIISYDFNINYTNKGLSSSLHELGDIGIKNANAKYTFGENIKITSKTTTYMAGLIYRALGKLFTKEGIKNVSGIVGMYNYSKEYAKAGLAYYIFFLATISVNLGIMNLLPFPALDGGKILLTIIETITHKKTDAKIENLINTIGFSLLMVLMAVVTLKDILNLI